MAFFALACLSARADDWNKSFPVSGKAEVHVDANDAEIEVRASDGKQIEAHITTRGWKIGPNEVRITDRQTGDRLDLEVRRPSHHFCIGVCNQNVRVELTVPREADLDLHSGDGNIRVSDVKGNLHLDTSDGSIEARAVDGKLNADTRDGHIRTDGRFDALDLHTGDGHVETEVRAGSRMASGWTIRTGDGRIELRLPPDFSADLDAHTGDGHVDIDFPVTVTGSMHENTVRGKMNGGGQLLELRTGDGNITVGKM
jgi:hypothetical protein